VADAIQRARAALLQEQEADGHWCYPLEADCTIPAEYVLMRHFIGDVDPELEQRIAPYLRRHQTENGGWPLYHGGPFDISCTVKAYWALKLVGDDIDAPHMRRAREAILAHGGAARCNVFTRIAMALFGLIPWRGAPWLPVEIVLLPRFGPFHLTKVSYWSRTVMVPLAILCTLKARAQNPTGHDLNELFVVSPDEERHWHPVRSRRNRFYLTCERTLRHFDRWIPGFVRRRAIERALSWTIERLNGEDGLGGIFPAMVNAHEVFVVLGRPEHEEQRRTTRRAIDRLLVHEESETWCQPCFSPVWDTALASLALQEAALGPPDETTADALQRAHVWLLGRQVLTGPADWRWNRPDLPPGGWAFQYANPHYPDLDDTSLVAWALWRADSERFEPAVDRAATWFTGMQSRSGGFASFDADNTFYHLNHIPFADHGALLDPPTSDVTARCVAVLGLLSRPEHREARQRALAFLASEQEDDGSWFGRWGTNYIYGTWSVLCALEHVEDSGFDERIERAVRWLSSVQRPDGSWGESNDSYAEPETAGRGSVGTAVQTAWAVLALIAAGRADDPAVERGVEFLLASQDGDGSWWDESFNAPGFPRVFYLRYHGYARIFPLWALARFRRARHARA